MLVFRQQHHRLLLAPHLRMLASETAAFVGVPAYDMLVSWLIDCAEIESAVTDALRPDYDNLHPLAQGFGEATRAAADAVVASWEHEPDSVLAAAARLTRALRQLQSRPWPQAIETIQRPVSEGYAYYGLTPEMYIRGAIAIAERFTPLRACVIGVRSIGTSLAAIVAGTLASRDIACDCVSVRPRGHPFDRHLALASPMTERWRASSGAGALFVIVDEGPGLSGSSFAAVVKALLDIGIDTSRIVVMPSAPIDLDRLCSPHARMLLSRVTSISTAFEDVAPAAIVGLRDVSAGAWRADSFAETEEYPAVFPQHERRKYREDADGAWLKWIGLSRYGAANYARAHQVAEWGMAPPPVSMSNGFMLMPDIPGTPLRPESRPPGIIEALADYLARIACESRRLTARSDHADLIEMLCTNAREGLGPRGLERAEAIARTKLNDKTVIDWFVHPDARMMPHEWLRTPTGGFAKTDGFEHHDDHFFPGLTDIAWDVAGTLVEWHLTPDEEAALLNRYRACSGDAHIAPRLGFFRAAYSAFRLGYSSLAASALAGTPDGDRFAIQRDRYEARLRGALGISIGITRSDGSSGRRSPQRRPGRAAGSCDADADHTPPG